MDFMESASIYSAVSVPAIPLWAIGLILAMTLPGAAYIGHALGRRRRARSTPEGREIDAASGATTLGAILALLGLLLAFSFGSTLSWAEKRKDAVVDEAAALGTAFLRADLLPEPGRSDLQAALFAYAQTRLIDPAEIHDLTTARATIALSMEAQSVLWPLTLQATQEPVAPPVRTFVAGAMNDVLDAHSYRMATLSTPIADAAALMLLASAITALFILGNRSALQGRPLTWRTLVFAAFLAVVMLTISDLERGHHGFIKNDVDSMRATILDMQNALAAPG